MNKIIVLLILIANVLNAQTEVQIGNTSEIATVFPSAAAYIKGKLLFSPFSSDTSVFTISNVGGSWKTVPVRLSTLRSSGGTTSPWSISAGYTDYSAGVVTIGGDFAPASPAGKMTLGSYATGGYNYIQSYAGLPLYLNPIGNNTILSNDTYTNYILAGKFTSNSEAKMQLKNNKFTQFSVESTFYPNGRLFFGMVATGYGSFMSQNSYYLGGGTYVPSDSHSSIMQFDDVGNTVFYNTNGLTADVSYTPTERFKIGINGNVTIASQVGAGLGLAQFTAGGVIQRTAIDPANIITTANRQLPTVWTTATRPTAAGGEYPMGFNTTTGKHEGWDGTTWNAFY